MSNLSWRLILVTSTSGLLFGGLTILAWFSGFEQRVALIMLAGIGKIMAFCADERPVRHALVAGFLAGLIAIWTQAAFLPLYFENNPAYRLIEIPFGMTARTYTTLAAPFGGLFAGAIASAIAWPVSIVIRRWRIARRN